MIRRRRSKQLKNTINKIVRDYYIINCYFVFLFTLILFMEKVAQKEKKCQCFFLKNTILHFFLKIFFLFYWCIILFIPIIFLTARALHPPASFYDSVVEWWLLLISFFVTPCADFPTTSAGLSPMTSSVIHLCHPLDT